MYNIRTYTALRPRQFFFTRFVNAYLCEAFFATYNKRLTITHMPKDYHLQVLCFESVYMCDCVRSIMLSYIIYIYIYNNIFLIFLVYLNLQYKIIQCVNQSGGFESQRDIEEGGRGWRRVSSGTPWCLRGAINTPQGVHTYIHIYKNTNSHIFRDQTMAGEV